MANNLRRMVDILEVIVQTFASATIDSDFEITKYHHDMHDIMLSWQGKDGIGRNIHVVVDGSPFASGGYFVNSEINAWLDDEAVLKRRAWHSAGPDGVSVRDSSDFSYKKIGEIVVMLTKAYKMIQSCDESALIFIGDLTPDPRKPRTA